MEYTAAVITISDKGARGERVDTSGPSLVRMLEAAGYRVVHTAMLPDERELIQRELIRCADEQEIALVLTTGGTGFSPPQPWLPPFWPGCSSMVCPYGSASAGPWPSAACFPWACVWGTGPPPGAVGPPFSWAPCSPLCWWSR